MVSGGTKRIVVIKDISSNIVEEAILILKTEPGAGNGEVKKGPAKMGKSDDGFLLKEAERIIRDYIREYEDNLREAGKKASLRDCRDRRRFITNTIINLALVGSIALLLFFIMKLF